MGLSRRESEIKNWEPIGATFFRDNLAADIREQRYSIVVIDKDVEDNVRVLLITALRGKLLALPSAPQRMLATQKV